MAKRRRRTGNHTSNVQWLYVVLNPTIAIMAALAGGLFGMDWKILAFACPFLVLTKIGITGNPEARIKEIQETSPGLDFMPVKIRIPFAYQVEQLLHRVFHFLHIPWFGSGKTEWFVGLVGVVGVGLYLLVNAIFRTV